MKINDLVKENLIIIFVPSTNKNSPFCLRCTPSAKNFKLWKNQFPLAIIFPLLCELTIFTSTNWHFSLCVFLMPRALYNSIYVFSNAWCIPSPLPLVVLNCFSLQKDVSSLCVSERETWHWVVISLFLLCENLWFPCM